MEKNLEYAIKSALFGVAVGDALGVPFEFRSSEEMKANPATDMVGFGTWHQPAGTWSDDTSLTLCLADALTIGYNLFTIAATFVRWKYYAFWTARGKVFDIGVTTANSIDQLDPIVGAGTLEDFKNLKKQATETDNGNGSLMRILPLLFCVKGKPLAEQFEIVWDVSSLTHKHIRSAMACMIYLKLAEHLLAGEEKVIAYKNTQIEILNLWTEISFDSSEQQHFLRVIKNDITKLPVADLKSGGYVIESLEASTYCFLTHDNYHDSVLAAVNLGFDTDTTAAITGGLAGLYYGFDQIPEEWRFQVAKREDILELSSRLAQSLEVID